MGLGSNHPQWPYPWVQPVEVNILMVADGERITYAKNQDFSLSDLLDTLNQSPWWVQFNVTKAHRGTDMFSTPDIPNFGFANAGVDLSAYDEIWVFGDDGADLTPKENAAIAKFMDAGGGLFATGDHDELGAGMGAGLLRAGLMRKWKYGGPLGDPPPVSGNHRHDTLVPGPDGITDFFDQSDDRPQTISIRPKWGWSAFPFVEESFPHALLCGSKGPISVLPDHMHEGECALPQDFSGNYTADTYTTVQWPGTVRPEIIADATVNAHTDPVFGAVDPKTFGVIAAYDGHAASVGRVATDATWHHWFNVNLTGEVSPTLSFGTPEPIDSLGFNASPQGKKIFAQIKEYHRNVAMWLAPAAKIKAMFDTAVAGLPWIPHLNEMGPKVPIVKLGAAAVDAIGRSASQCIIAEWIGIHLPQTVQPLFDPTIGERNGVRDPAPMRGLYLYREFALGGVVREILTMHAERRLRNADRTTLRAAVERGLRNGFAELISYERRAAQHTELLTEALRDFVSEKAETAVGRAAQTANV